jgi:hypothetical protein
MHFRTVTAAAVAALGLALPAIGTAQTTTRSTTATDDSWRMPYQRGFWGHAGLSWGRGELDASCPAGTSCDLKDNRVFRGFVGGRFNNAVGLELGAINIGDYKRGGGTTDGWGVDIALVAGIPIGANSAIFGKLGTLYSRTDVTGVGIPTGEESDWGVRWGIGGQIGFTPQWAVRLDFDRFEVGLPGGKEDLDTLMVGAQYTFR